MALHEGCEGSKNTKEMNIHGKIDSELDEVDLIDKVIYGKSGFCSN